MVVEVAGGGEGWPPAVVYCSPSPLVVVHVMDSGDGPKVLGLLLGLPGSFIMDDECCDCTDRLPYDVDT